MTVITEKTFESTIESLLLAGGIDSAIQEETAIREVITAEGDYIPGSYHKRSPDDYDRSLCLICKDVIDFILITQPKPWEKLKKSVSDDPRRHLLERLAKEISLHGTLHVLRKGIKDLGCKFQLCYFPPASGLNPENLRHYQANIFSIVRQLKYSLKNENSLDLVLFINGLPLFIAELKNPLNNQTVLHAINQYQKTRDPREPLFAFRRCLAHFAVDPDYVYYTTQLKGDDTRFMPFNKGNNGGAGNPPSWKGFATAYLWEQLWSRDSVLNLLQYFIHEFEELDEYGNKTGNTGIIFPRYHQLDSVRRMIRHAREHGAGQRYLVQHSAGSGKSNSIAWLAHQLSVLHNDKDERVFDSVVVVTDRRILDRQLQATVSAFEQTLGTVETITESSQQLRTALEQGKNIIVSTLQKFPVISEFVQSLPGRHFAVIIDEAHSSQSGEASRHLNKVLSAGSLEEAEKLDEDTEERDDLEDRIVEAIKQRGHLPHVSYFAFTATPKPKTLELFGSPRKGGGFEPFSLYSMRQAIDESFILDVLKHYTTYHAYWNLLKKIKDDPTFDKVKASRLMLSFVDLHEHTIAKKVEVIVEHFNSQVLGRIHNQAKAMVVTRSRLHAVRYKQAIDAYIQKQGYPFKALVAFSGTVKDGGIDYTEPGMNGFPEKQTAETFKQSPYRLMVVAEKFQTGYDMPLLHTMYVDKKLKGLHAVQTLSRLNRVHSGKEETFVLDFANEADDIQKAFQPYYECTALSEATDPNLLHDLQTRLEGYHLFTQQDVGAFAEVYFNPKGTQDKLYAVLRPSEDRYKSLPSDDKSKFRSALSDFVRLYSFLSQVVTFVDADLEKLFVFSRYLLRRCLPDKERLPIEVQEAIDLGSYRLDINQEDKPIELDRGKGEMKPENPLTEGDVIKSMEALSKIIQDLNERFGTDFDEEDRLVINQIEERLAEDERLKQSILVNTPENAMLTFRNVLTDMLQGMVDTNFKFYQHLNKDPQFADYLTKSLFDRYRKSQGY